MEYYTTVKNDSSAEGDFYKKKLPLDRHLYSVLIRVIYIFITSFLVTILSRLMYYTSESVLLL